MSALFLLTATPLFAQTNRAGIGTLVMLVLFILGSMWIGLLANRATQGTSFLKGFFLGNRGLGAWALALTATVQSGGTFMGFPSLVYAHGWAVALWIAGYMVVPITGFGILGKRLAQLSRRTGAITVPDMFRARFASPTLGLFASLLILFYMTAMMVAQFKAGALVMKNAWPGSGSLALSEDEPAFKLTKERIDALEKEKRVEKLDGKDVQSLLLAPPILGAVRSLEGKGFRSENELYSALATGLSANPETKSLPPKEVSRIRKVVKGAAKQLDLLYFVGLVIFTVTVVGYTLMGGFLAAVWTDLFQSIMMWVGVLLLLFLALWHVGGMEQATLQAIQNTDPVNGSYVFGPGYDSSASGREFMPIGLACSVFFIWVFSGVGSPAGMVRIMASESTAVIRRSIYLLSLYNACIYIPLIIICICGRAMIKDLAVSDEIIPQVTLAVTNFPGGSIVAGLILAAPFGAVMATVSSYLVVISSGLVRDVYQRFLNPQASQNQLRRMSYGAMIFVGALAIALNIEPVAYLQAIVVFSGTGAAATFCVPALMLCYWRRATVAGMISAMLAGAGTLLCMYVVGTLRIYGDQKIGVATDFTPYYLFGLEPIVWGLLVSLIAGVGMSLLTDPPPEELLCELFDGDKPAVAA